MIRGTAVDGDGVRERRRIGGSSAVKRETAVFLALLPKPVLWLIILTVCPLEAASTTSRITQWHRPRRSHGQCHHRRGPAAGRGDRRIRARLGRPWLRGALALARAVPV